MDEEGMYPCGACGKGRLPSGMELCVPCQRMTESSCTHQDCNRPVHVENYLPMVERKVRRYCIVHEEDEPV